jgi:hypothetical protein
MIEQTIADAPAFSARRIVVRASGLLLAFERIALMGLMYLLTALILVNVVPAIRTSRSTGSMNRPSIAWSG